VLLEGEVVLASGLRGDGNEEGAALAELSMKVAPGFEFGDAVGIPTAAEEINYERAEGEEGSGTDEFMRDCVFKSEGRSLRSGLQDAVLDAGIEEFCGRFLRDGETLGLDEGARVLGDAIELVLQGGGHNYIIAAISVVVLVTFSSWQDIAGAADFLAATVLL
jgi:hypothetical protein